MSNVKALIEQFVQTYNGEGSNVYPLYADKLEWLEMPSGRKGGREDLFAALRAVRESITDMSLTILSITADSDRGVLESIWRGRKSDDGASISARVIWFLAFKDGKIVLEHDYTVPAAD